MSIALVAHTIQGSTSSNGFTTTGIDTTGSNFIIVSVNLGNATSTGTLTDSNSNTWNALTQYTGSFSDRYIQFFYAKSATVGASHTFSISGTSNFPSLGIAAFSGVDTSTPFDVENGNANGFNNSVQTGNVTPAGANELIFTSLNHDNSDTPTINSSQTILDTLAGGGFGHQGHLTAYEIQTTGTARNPTWSWTNSDRNVANIAAFKSAATDALMAQIWM